MATFAELWNSGGVPKAEPKQEWQTRESFANHKAPNAFQAEQLAFAKRNGVSYAKLKTMGLGDYVEPIGATDQPATEKGQDDLDNNDLKDYVQRITKAALSGASISEAGGLDAAAAYEAETEGEDEED